MRRRVRAFTLIEVMFAMTLTAVAVIGIIATILYVREALEVDKHRLIAQNHCRRYLEMVRRNNYDSIPTGFSVQIDDFDTPDYVSEASDLVATVDISVYDLILDSGSYVLDLSNPLTSMPNNPDDRPGRRVFVEVAVSWNRVGRMSDRVETEVLQTYVTAR